MTTGRRQIAAAPRARDSTGSSGPASGTYASPAAALSPRSEEAVSHAIRVLCVDDHAVLVEGLQAQFAIEGKLEVVGRLATATRLLDEVDRLNPDVVLLDIEMPGADAFEMTDRLKHAHPETLVVVLSAHIRDVFVSASLSAGAAAYFAKSDELEDILAGICKVVQDRTVPFLLGPKVAERCRPLPGAGGSSYAPWGAADGRRTEDLGPGTRLETLTARESEILRLIGKGLSRTQIAKQLCRSAKTIDGHQKRMLTKLGLPGRADLIRFAIREGLAQA